MSDRERRYDAKLKADATKMDRESGSSEPGVLELSKEWENPVTKFNPSWNSLLELQETREPYSTLGSKPLCSEQREFRKQWQLRIKQIQKVVNANITNSQFCPDCMTPFALIISFTIMEDFECYRCHKTVRLSLFDDMFPIPSSEEAFIKLMLRWGVIVKKELQSYFGHNTPNESLFVLLR